MIPKLPSLRMIGLAFGGLGLLGLGLALMLAKADARHWEKRFKAEEQARAADVAAWERATWETTFRHVYNAERVRLARAAIDERTIDALQDDRTRAAAGLERLQRQAAAHLGSPGRPDLSAEREATCRAVAGTGCEAIPAILKAAQDNTDQLLAWIEWGKAQGLVPSVAPVPNAALP